jgi:hypothetical protein
LIADKKSLPTKTTHPSSYRLNHLSIIGNAGTSSINHGNGETEVIVEDADEDTEHPHDSMHFQNDQESDKKMSPDPFEQIEKK